MTVDKVMQKKQMIKAQAVDGKIILEKITDIEDLAGSLGGKIKLSDKELRQARDNFSKQWARKQS